MGEHVSHQISVPTAGFGAAARLDPTPGSSGAVVWSCGPRCSSSTELCLHLRIAYGGQPACRPHPMTALNLSPQEAE